MQCLNCNTEFAGNFCPQCSQKSSTKKLTVLSVIKDFMAAFSDSDKGFLKTVIDLSKNPGLTINNYIDGKRSRYLSAGKYTFFLTILFTINMNYLEHHFGMFESLIKGLDKATVTMDGTSNIHITNKGENVGIYKASTGKEIKEGDAINVDFDFMGTTYKKTTSKGELLEFLQKMIPHYHRTLFDVLKFLFIVWIPIFSLFSSLFFYKAKYNLAEHITFNSFIYSHILLIFMMLSPFYWLLPETSGVTFFAASTSSLFYLVFAYMQFFMTRKYRLFKTLMSLSISFFTYSSVIMCFVIILAFYVAIDNFHLL